MNPEAVGISRSALALLLNLMNTPRMESAVDYLNSSGVFDEVLAARLLSPVNSGQTTTCVDGKDRELIRNPDGPDYRYFSEAVGWVDVSANGICRFRLDPQRVLALIRGWLDISQRQAVTNLQVDAIWDLGDMWVGKRRLAVLFMRRAHLAASVTNLRNALLNFPRRRSAIVLTDVAINSYGPSLPGEPLCIALGDLLLPEQLCVSVIEKDMIGELIGYGPAQTEHKAPVSCSDDGGELHVNGEDYFFTGLTQKRIIRLLFDAWEAGQSRLRTTAVLEEAESKATAMSQAFSGYKGDWKKVIGYGDGCCWLIV